MLKCCSYYTHADFIGIEFPSYGEFLFDICAWRNENNGLIGRVATELALIGIALIACIDFVIRSSLAFLANLFGEDPSLEFLIVSNVALCSIQALLINPFVKNITSSLIDMSDIHKIHPNLSTDSLNYSRLWGSLKLKPFFEFNDYEKSYLELKTLSHWLGWKSTVEVHGNSFDLQGTSGTWMFDSLAGALAKFQESDDFKHHQLGSEKAAILQEALSSAYSEKSTKKIVARIQDRKLTFKSAGWYSHAIALAFYGDYMAVGNRGTGAYPEYTTLEVYKIDHSLFTMEIDREINSFPLKDEESARQYFYRTLPAKLSPTGQAEKDALCKEFASIAPGFSKGHDCCSLASKKAALRFAWAMLLSDLKQARLESKIFTDWTAVQHYKAITPETFSAVKEKKELESLAQFKARRKWNKLLYNRWQAGYCPYSKWLFRGFNRIGG